MGWRDFEIPTTPNDKSDKSDKTLELGSSVNSVSSVTGVNPENGSNRQGPEAPNIWRDLPLSDLTSLDLRLRIVAPDNADDWTLDDWVVWIEERSAILEFDGEYSREQADQEAMLIWRLYRHREAQS